MSGACTEQDPTPPAGHYKSTGMTPFAIKRGLRLQTAESRFCSEGVVAERLGVRSHELRMTRIGVVVATVGEVDPAWFEFFQAPHSVDCYWS